MIYRLWEYTYYWFNVAAMKICTKCDDEKDDDDFRTIKEKKKSGKIYEYVQKYCKKCATAEAWKRYYAKPEKYRAIKRKASMRDYNKRREIIIQKWKDTRKQPDNGILKYQREYNTKHFEKIKQQHKAPAKKFQEKAKTQLSDYYVANNLKQHLPLTVAEIRANKELMEFNRTRLELKRLITKNKTIK